MRIAWAWLVVWSAASCTDPVAPVVPACDDDFHPALCEGEEDCETDERGCRVCTCEYED